LPASASPDTTRPAPRPTVVLGVGNLVCGDDGVGIHAVQALTAMPLPEGVEVVEGGTTPFDALSTVGPIGKLIVVDAAEMGEQPGTVRRLALEDLAGAEGAGMSLHDLDLLWALDALRATGQAPEEVVIVGVQPASLAWSTELSPAVAARMPEVTEAVLSETLGAA